MSRTIEVTVYQFSELSDKAKEVARDWYRGQIDSSDFEFTIEDADTCAALLGIEIDRRNAKTIGGQVYTEPAIYWNLSYSQGDGASFDGSYAYKAGSCKAIRKHAPQDAILHRIADHLRDIQKEHAYKLTARMSTTNYGNLTVSVEDSRDDSRDIGDAEKTVNDLLNSFAYWIYKQLREQNDYLYSAESVDESIQANEYEFDISGALSTV